MKKSILIVTMITLSSVGFSQTISNTNNPVDTTKNIVVNDLGYNLKVLGDETAESSLNWSKEEKEWFKSTFVYKRGQFKVPTTPIVDPFSNK
jgi:hypothetical protein